MLTFIVSVTARQLPLLVDVSTSLIFPVVISFACKLYEVFKTNSSSNEPTPVLVQLPLDEPCVTLPFKETGLLEQTVWSAPALTTGGGVIVSFSVSLTSAQVPLFVDVRIRKTSPVAVSALLGVYVVERRLLLLKSPDPLRLQILVTDAPPT